MLAKINRSYVPAYWDDFFNDSFFKQVEGKNHNHNCASVNILEDEKGYVIEVAAPGVSREDLKIELDKDVLTISSEKNENKEENRQKFLRREFNFHSFKRSFQLPETIDQENIAASHESGILRLTLPKKEEMIEQAPRQIAVK